MRFFALALSTLGLFAAASPVVSERSTSVETVEKRQGGLDIAGLLNGATGQIAQQGSAISANPNDPATAQAGLEGITDILNSLIGTLQGAGANTDPSSSGLLGGLLGSLGLGSLGLKRDETFELLARQGSGNNLNAVGTALQGVLSQLQIVVGTLGPAAIAVPIVGQLLIALTPLLVAVVAGVNSLVPGLINLVNTLLVTVSGLLLSLAGASGAA